MDRAQSVERLPKPLDESPEYLLITRNLGCYRVIIVMVRARLCEIKNRHATTTTTTFLCCCCSRSEKLTKLAHVSPVMSAFDKNRALRTFLRRD